MSDYALKVISMILAMILIGFLFSYPAMLLWNCCLVPAISILQPVSWLQMYGITILIALIFPQARYTPKKG